MTVTRYTLTGDLVDVIGQQLVDTWSSRRPVPPVAWLETNLERGEGQITADLGVQLGTRILTLSAGKFTATGLVASNSADVQPTGLQYRVGCTFRNNATGSMDTWHSGWFNLTANSDLKTIAEAAPEPPDYATSPVIAQAQEARAGAEAARDLARDISQIDTSDDAIDAALQLPGSKSAVRLAASIAAITDPLGEQVDALPASIEAAAVRSRRSLLGPSVVVLGDSNTAGGIYMTGLMARTFGQFNVISVKGVGGNTSAQMLARLDTDVIAQQPTYCLVLAGTNGEVSLSVTQANLTEMYTRLRAAGIEPIAATIPPANTDPNGRPVALNAWITAYAAANGIALLDFYTALADPATGLFRAGYNSDDVHLTSRGNQAIVDATVAVLHDVMPPWQPLLSTTDIAPADITVNVVDFPTDPGNLQPLPLFELNRVFGDGSDQDPVISPRNYLTSVPAGFASEVVVVSGVPGRMVHATAPAGAGTGAIQYLCGGPGADNLRPIPIIPGRRYRASMRHRTRRCVANDARLLYGVETDNGVNFDVHTGGDKAMDVPDGVVSIEFTAPAGATHARVNFGMDVHGTSRTSAAEMWFGQITIRPVD